MTDSYNSVSISGNPGSYIIFDTEGDGNHTIGRSIYKITTNQGTSYFYLFTVGTDYFDLEVSYDASSDLFTYGITGSGSTIPNGTLLSNVVENDHSSLYDGWAYNNALYLLQQYGSCIIADHEDENPKLFWAPHNEFSPTHYQIFRAINYWDDPPDENDFNLIATVPSSTIEFTDTEIQINDVDWYITYKVRAKRIEGIKTYYSTYTNSTFTIGGLYKSSPKIATIKNNYTLLFNNYPNPFNPETQVSFSINQKEFVKLIVFNSLGELIKVLFNDIAYPNVNYQCNFDGSNFASGIYIYQIRSNSFTQSKKMLLLR